MSNFLDFLKNLFFDSTFQSILGALSPLLISLLVLVLRLISSRIKNERLKKLVLILPDAMELAESTGTSASNKLDIAVSYIKERVKKISDTEIKDFIESGIIISKTVNNKFSQEKSMSSESRISNSERRIKK